MTYSTNVIGHVKDLFSMNGRTIYGGVKENHPTGGTSIYLSEDFRKILTGVINVDSQGIVGPQEIEYAKQIGLTVTDVEL